MKILFVNPHLKIGGIATSLYNLLGELRKNEALQIDLVVFNPYFDEKFKDVSKGIEVISPLLLRLLFISKREALNNLKWHQLIGYFLLKILAKVVGVNQLRCFAMKYTPLNFNKKEYDAAIAFSNDIPRTKANFGCNDFVEYAVRSKTKISFIHNDLDKLGIDRNYALKRYKFFNAVVNVSKSCKDHFERLAPEYVSKSYLAHNFMDPKIICDKGKQPLKNLFPEEEISLITVARLDNKQKRIDRIIEVAQVLQQEGMDFSWYILGDGPDLEYLKKLVIDKKIEEKVIFMGFVQNPYPYIKAADCFVLSSDYEAQGMVLSEALILGTPIISTDFPAAKEFVDDGVNGFIVDKSVKALYEKITLISKDKSILTKMKSELGIEKGSLYAKKALDEFYNLINLTKQN